MLAVCWLFPAGTEIRIDTSCLDCGQPISVRMRDGEILEVNPPTAVGHMNVQFAILGSGDLQLENYFRDLPGRYPGKAGSFIGFNNELAHLIEAGSDFFLMPSLSEPCGLNQIYSMKYGTLPVVRATGGLNDTVENYNQETGSGTGFKFWEPGSEALYNTIYWAQDTYYNRKVHFQKLVQNAMQETFSWDKSAKEYIRMYYKALENINS